MSRAIVAGLIQDGYPAESITVIDRNPEKCALFRDTYGIHAFDDLDAGLTRADVLVLAIKPQDAAAACSLLRAHCAQHAPLVISVMAGITVATLGHWLGHHTAIVRAMPNTPAAIQAGATGLFANTATPLEHKNIAESILRATGVITWVDAETDLAAITALSGSGPAYYFYFMEIMAEIAVRMGLSQETAHLFAAQTAYGAAKLALASPEDFVTLRNQVTSKGGSTAAAIGSMQKNDLENLLAEAMLACQRRALELANPNQTNGQVSS